MRTVIDTNQLLKMTSSIKHSPLAKAWLEHKFQLVISKQLFTELLNVMARPKINRFITTKQKQNIINLIQKFGIFVIPISDAPPCRDPKDNVVIATALGGNANFIVTADKDLLDDKHLLNNLAKHNLKIVYPIEFLKSLK